MEQNEYMVMYVPSCQSYGDIEIDYYSTLEEAEKNAYSGEKIFKLIKEIV